ncbi:YhcN/YlaJ family sporulation lipoprotein [Shouchella clausii]|jgi:spore cortex protein|uniref:YhcN/YlaJ family sporulation lipoprotein n=2 Tax=Shouchella TaxID=2893057 RepID=A0A268NXG2_SHOCL|nr:MULTISPECIES: YhcN/YlaJ family sporulation lipoprotein [Shouchella]MCM3311812.1 YhcN/YlaJ family sporulation lipoprotein [Psychrobacillus sp. MER TA 17]ALA51853.1 Lipoprotein yhcN precursor [Shouchella clausii]KKI84510.1 hypothetical protein WZ76_20400 [Shouchella clausii]MBU3232116.1 YhcN/YlaJ family sporulation lipoprotein [Shouchella clausii]MBU3264406.1 YhcN/YlaJ family sporulation lipoprotein [Shouchella clausii]
MNRIKQFSAICLIGLVLTGCGMAQNNNDRDQQVDDNDNRETETRQQGYDDNAGPVEDRLEVADETAERVAELDEVERANVLIAGDNAYVAVMMTDRGEDEVTEELKEKIAEQVRKTDENMNNVYVSSNPDFVERARDYTDRINNGEPVKGFVDEFNETIRRIFPNAK